MKERIRFDSPEVIDLVYQAALDVALWGSILERLAKGHNAGVGFIGATFDGSLVIPLQSVGITSYLLSLLTSQYMSAEQNLLNRESMRRSFGDVFRTEDIVPPEKLRRTELYEQVIRPTGVDYGLVLQLILSKTSFGGFALYRDRITGSFTDGEVAALKRLAPHIIRSAKVAHRLAEAENRARLVCGTLDRLGIPILIADADSKIRYSNSSARAVLEAKDGLRAARGRLESRCTGENSLLRGFIRGAALCHKDGHRNPGGSISITRPDGRPPWEVVVAPLSAARDRLNWPAGDLAIVIASDPSAKPVSPAQYLQSRFALTPAECRVALVIGEGGSLKDLAERLGVSVNTVRTHLHRVFEKTGTRRQAELARLISNHPARVLLTNDFDPTGKLF